MLHTTWDSLFTVVHFADPFSLGPDWSIPYRKNPFSALWYLESGEIELQIGTETVRAAAGSLLLIPTGIPFRAGYFSLCRQHQTIALRFTLRTAENLDWFTLYRLPCLFPAATAAASAPLVYEVLHAFRDPADPCRRMRANALMHLLLSGLLGSAQDRIEPLAAVNVANREKIFILVRWIEEHLAERFALKDLADQVHLSGDYVHELFTAVLGETPMRYVNRQRLHKAKQLLRLHEQTMQEISELTGFSSAQYFARVFKDAEGMTPTEYQKASTQL